MKNLKSQEQSKFSLLNKKYEDLLVESSSLKYKFEELLDVKEGLGRRSGELEKERDLYRLKYKKAKNKKKELKKKLDSLEQQMQIVTRQKEIEMHEIEKQKENELLMSLSRREAMKEIQGKISMYKSKGINAYKNTQ
eukprot:TRINITY_DN4774_c0_g5_i4.p2 TRINITY_DN4774_c0_g5~~TRINITY_DN4774_c0_g5_i4.p2  ORF type:complete len:137 (+),score=50.24 TRINITY_DN4774_c0_g5_i4:141-551(+)